MKNPKAKGTKSEYKVRKIFENYGWFVIRSTGSFSPVDLVCIRDRKVILVQIKSSSKKIVYLKEEVPEEIEGIKTILVVDFGRHGLKVVKYNKKVKYSDGIELVEFIKRMNKKGPVA